ncbi:uncharacterized protein LOC107267061 isoform X3 [Cephus cinctus]|uniref:Uncharacterized protein LOC107267061 isoform X3 n=1 Tax=Cephus cinctus TaxID=211228 RepID=A0AAJ7FIR0_CEPCN|nr:uncharacterized protein LOC107267061 isoform X3 [Cephus cinctus]
MMFLVVIFHELLQQKPRRQQTVIEPSLHYMIRVVSVGVFILTDLSGDVIDAIRPDLEAFASLWSALRKNYKGTNITRTVARLLHMYQPEDGVLAYERLLRTLYVLLEDFDGDGLQLLVSMVPPPKGVKEDTIKEVFHRATGFVRMDAPLFHRNNNSIAMDGSKVSNGSTVLPGESASCIPRSNSMYTNPKNVQTVKTESYTSNQKSPQMIPQEADVFRGFPPNEITNTQSHIQNLNNFYRPSNYDHPPHQTYVNFSQVVGQNCGDAKQLPTNTVLAPGYRLKWLQAPYLLQKSPYPPCRDVYLKTIDNKYLRLPLSKMNDICRPDVLYSSQIPYYECLHTKSNTMTSGLLEKVQIPQDNENYSKETSTKRDETVESQKHDNMQNAVFSRIYNDMDTIKKHEGSYKINYDTDTCCTANQLLNANVGQENKDIKIRIQNNGTELENVMKPLKQFEEEVRRRQRAIQEDIFKMDVVRCNESNQSIESQEALRLDDLTVNVNLKQSVCNFFKRVIDGATVKTRNLPCTRPLSEIPQPITLNPDLSNITSQWPYTAPQFCAIQDTNISLENKHYEVLANSSLRSDQNFPIRDSTSIKEENIRKVTRRRKADSTGKSKSQKITQRILNPLKTVETGSNISEPNINSNLDPVYPNYPTSDQGVLLQQASTLTEMAAYKKQYYDALLRIQRAKAAAANSLALSSVGSSTGYDPYYFSYLNLQQQMLQQQQQHQQQHQHLLLGPRFTAQRLVRPAHMNMHATATPWIRPPDWTYPFGQYDFTRHTHPPHFSQSNNIRFMMPNSTTMNAQKYMEDLQTQSRPGVKRRKLEEIVGKLKETDNSGDHMTFFQCLI